MYQHWDCLRDNSSSVQGKITKFGLDAQKTVFKICIVLGGSLAYDKVKFDLTVSQSQPSARAVSSYVVLLFGAIYWCRKPAVCRRLTTLLLELQIFLHIYFKRKYEYMTSKLIIR